MSNLEDIYKQIGQEAQKYNIDKIVLFGSRARGDNKPKSDIDLAVYGNLSIAENNQFYFFIQEALPTLLEVDIVFIHHKTSQELLDNIEKDGVVIYEKI